MDAYFVICPVEFSRLSKCSRLLFVCSDSTFWIERIFLHSLAINDGPSAPRHHSDSQYDFIKNDCGLVKKNNFFFSLNKTLICG